jgi:hypothetical protein
MAISFRASALNKATSTTSVTVAKPAGTVIGDVMCAGFQVSSTGDTINTPSGWTKDYDLSSNFHHIAVFHKVAGGSEPANYTFTITGSNRDLAAGIDTYIGVDNATPIHNSGQLVDLNFITTHPSPTVAVTVANCWSWVFLTAEGFASGIGQQAGYVTRANMDYTPCFCETDDSNGTISTGSYNAGNWTTVQTKETIMVDMILAPAGAGGHRADLMPVMGAV